MLPATAAMKAALLKTAAVVTHLLEFQFAPGTERYCDWEADVIDVTAGVTYQPIALQLQGTINEGQNGDASAMSIAMSATTPGILDSILNECRWRKLIWRIGVIENGVLVKDPLVVTARWMMPGDLVVNEGVYTIGIQLEPYWSLARLTAPRTRSHADQLTIDDQDDAFVDAGVNFNLDRTEFVQKGGF